VRVSKGIFLLSVDSDNELCNQAVEIDFRMIIGRQVDRIEHMAYWVFRNGRQQRLGALSIPLEVFNNREIARVFKVGRVNWARRRSIKEANPMETFPFPLLPILIALRHGLWAVWD
jgi:hypothetical protein